MSSEYDKKLCDGRIQNEVFVKKSLSSSKNKAVVANLKLKTEFKKGYCCPVGDIALL